MENLVIPFIALVVSSTWLYRAEDICNRRYEDVPFYDTTFFTVIKAATLIILLVALISAWVVAGFGPGFIFLGILVAGIIAQFIYAPILIAIFGVGGIGAILPTLCVIASAIWFFASF